MKKYSKKKGTLWFTTSLILIFLSAVPLTSAIPVDEWNSSNSRIVVGTINPDYYGCVVDSSNAEIIANRFSPPLPIINDTAVNLFVKTNFNLIVVGGPVANSLALDLVSSGESGVDWYNSAGDIETMYNVFATGKDVIISAGKDRVSTLDALQALAGTLPSPAPLAGGTMEIHHIDVGQADATLLISPSGKTVLFDSGETHYMSGNKALIISNYVQSVTGGTNLDYYINSHMHLDHIGYVTYGGIWELINTYGFTVGKSYVRDYNEILGTTSGTYENFTKWITLDGGDAQLNLELVDSSKTPFAIDLGDGVKVDVLAVNAESVITPGDYSGDASPPSENDFSIVTIVRYGKFDEIIAGDLSGEDATSSFGYYYTDIESVYGPAIGDVEIYRVNHHGSSHSTNLAFLSAIDPEVSIITVGDANTYKHPNYEVINRVKATSDLYMTEHGDQNGDDAVTGDEVDYTDVVVGGDIVVHVTDPSGPGYTVEGVVYGTGTSPICGNGIVEWGEECDGGAGCSPTCTLLGSSQVVINEIAWMGTTTYFGDEWIELYNAGDLGQDLTGWTLVAADGAPDITLSGTIPAGEYFLLERSDDDSVSGITADLIYTGALSNTFEKLQLKDSGGAVVDETPDGASWAAGDNTEKATMYRVSPDANTWATSTASYSVGKGTPRATN
jgi:beta-lactamase superfamily II metal-dependent hydrolase